MPTMVTFQAGRVALVTLLAGLAVACSGEQQDWRSAESADTSEAWGRFLEQHPDSELAGQARARVAQLDVKRDWQLADSIGTVEAYRAFLAQHPTGRWSEEARIRIEGFSLGSAPRIAPPTPEELAASERAGVRALHLASAVMPASAPESLQPQTAAAPEVQSAVPAAENTNDESGGPERVLAQPGEAAQPAGEIAQVSAPAAATAPTPAPAPAPGSTNTYAATQMLAAGGYGVQLGAFSSEASAGREWQRLQGRFGAELGGLSPHIVLASTGSGELYRLQVAAAGEAQARAICDSLKGQAQACVPVLAR
jgi:cell division septation protein DedD